MKFNLVGAKLPNTNDLYFRSKQHELVEQYSAARIFLNETETDDWNHWFNPVDDKQAEKAYVELMIELDEYRLKEKYGK